MLTARARHLGRCRHLLYKSCKQSRVRACSQGKINWLKNVSSGSVSQRCLHQRPTGLIKCFIGVYTTLKTYENKYYLKTYSNIIEQPGSSAASCTLCTRASCHGSNSVPPSASRAHSFCSEPLSISWITQGRNPQDLTFTTQPSMQSPFTRRHGPSALNTHGPTCNPVPEGTAAGSRAPAGLEQGGGGSVPIPGLTAITISLYPNSKPSADSATGAFPKQFL